MSLRLNCLGLLLGLFLASEVLALGLGDIRLDSALNEPLTAEIELLSATPEELESLRVGLASAETFARYGIDRPVYLTRLTFRVQARGAGHVVRVTSPEPITEPFLTFLVEANWSRGRLLREYTVLLDPPTFAPPPATAGAEAVTAPSQAREADRGRIERPAPPPAARPAPAAAGDDFDTAPGGDYRVARGDTLWRIAERVRPDNRLSMNQTMLAIYEANPDAFAGNINVLRANSQLRIPSADEIFRISRGAALSEIRRQNQAWQGGAPAPQTTLTLVPPDAEQTPYQGGAGTAPAGATDAATQARIRQLEARITEQESLLEIRDSELAQLRAELARLREERAAAGAAEPVPTEEPEPVADEPVADTEPPADEIFVDDETADAVDAVGPDDQPAETEPEAEPARPAPAVVTTSRDEPGLVDTIIETVTGFWGIVGAALVVVLGLLVWFARRASSSSEDADTGVWDALDAEDADSESVASTERLRAMARDDDTSIVVVEQDKGGDTLAGDTVETPRMPDDDDSGDISAPEQPVSLEDTFSSETAINLDQSDPVAEADFHMAYGLYDQAADLINGALAVEPDRSDLMAKLCEIYFVWGNRDAFVDAATRLKDAVGDDPRGDWDKVVIMGQQIAGDHALFAQARAGGAATQEIDLDFEGGGDASSALDIDFAGDGGGSDVIDLGEEDDGAATMAADDDALDFSFDDETDTSASITREMPGRGRGASSNDDPTVESPTLSNEAIDDDITQESPALSSNEDWDDDTTQESRTVEQRRDALDSTSELPAFGDDEPTGTEFGDSRSADATAEIDLDDLGLDLEGLGGDDDLLGDDEATGTGLSDALAETGKNEQLDDDLARTGSNEKPDDNLLDATGQTQVLPEDFTVETSNKLKQLSDEDATMLAPGPGADDADFDFAKTEALPKEAYDDLEDTTEKPTPGSTDMDLDLDDLTAALKLSESGDTIEQHRDDATVQQRRPGSDDLDLDLGLDMDDPTQALGPEDVSDDLQEARTMTEVGTKLDLARAYVDMGDPGGARNILEEVLEEGDESQRQQAKQLLDSLPG